MFSLINSTNLCAQPQLVLDALGEERLLLVVKGSFELDGEALRPAGASVVLADQYRGDPTSTSLVATSEIVLFKPLPDLLLSGHAYPEERGGTIGVVSFRVGTWSKDALVFGDRVWTRGVTGLQHGSSRRRVEPRARRPPTSRRPPSAGSTFLAAAASRQASISSSRRARRHASV